MTQFSSGDKVSWSTPQGKTRGKINRKVTHDTKTYGHHFKATKQNPRYEVTSDKTGKKAVHKPESLTKE